MAKQDYSTFFESISVTSTTAGAGADVVYTVPTNHDAEVTFCVVTNAGAVKNISIQVYHEDDVTYHYLLRSHAIPGNDAYKLVGQDRLYLHAGDKIVAYKTGGTFDVTVSGKLFYNPTRNV